LLAFTGVQFPFACFIKTSY